MAGDDSTQAPVQSVAIKLPSFWTAHPVAWFNQAEAQFNSRSPPITSQQTKFWMVVAALGQDTAGKVQAMVSTPPSDAPYDKLRAKLLKAYELSESQRAELILFGPHLGDRRPSDLLTEMTNWLASADQDMLFRQAFLRKLPKEVRVPLGASQFKNVEELGEQADRLWLEHQGVLQTHAVEAEDTSPVLEPDQVEAVSHKLPPRPPAFVRRYSKARPRPSSTPHKQPSLPLQSPADHSSPRICSYHGKFGLQARQCQQPCDFLALTKNGPPGRI